MGVNEGRPDSIEAPDAGDSGIKCQGTATYAGEAEPCGKFTVAFHSFHACANEYCGKYGEAIYYEDGRGASSSQADGGNYYSSEAMAAAREIGR